MNVVGYLITLANLQSYQQSGGPLKDLQIRVSQVRTLASELQNHPEFTLEGFKQSGYQQVGDVGKYLSQNLRNYLFNGNVEPQDEGVILTLHYAKKVPEAQAIVSDQKDGTLSYYVHKNEGLSHDERENVFRYLDALKGYSRGKRDLMMDVNN